MLFSRSPGRLTITISNWKDTKTDIPDLLLKITWKYPVNMIPPNPPNAPILWTLSKNKTPVILCISCILRVVIDNLFIKSASPNYKLGKKQQTGGVRSNEDHMNEICRDSTKRFNSETHDSTQDPILIRREQIASKGGYDAIKRSGYSLNSKVRSFYTFIYIHLKI